ncbi:uncharacterized mitochondrial protein AtMg00810-like [Nicotiana tomentosiformis]|uniref:uncharacterized mitochondrial protein AtMg00810-like n=1 Tax=Nicotiana tomentosiformis TaxID=4098 RepID=UPI001448849A|nr:uncharacterized mitochondrial protein AtMg00810-like [Nicotiana tomentosiformis]
MEAAYRIVKYIKNESDLGVFLSNKPKDKITAFCDADWAAYPQTRKSITGFLVKIGDSTVSRKSNKQTIISRSSAESEYRSMTSSVAELTWLLGKLKEIGLKFELLVTICTNSKAAIQIAANPVFHERTKHIEIDCQYKRENKTGTCDD